jgi:hypothetical protein
MKFVPIFSRGKPCRQFFDTFCIFILMYYQRQIWQIGISIRGNQKPDWNIFANWLTDWLVEILCVSNPAQVFSLPVSQAVSYSNMKLDLRNIFQYVYSIHVLLLIFFIHQMLQHLVHLLLFNHSSVSLFLCREYEVAQMPNMLIKSGVVVCQEKAKLFWAIDSTIFCNVHILGTSKMAN